jgi:hypothetical protein
MAEKYELEEIQWAVVTAGKRFKVELRHQRQH